MFISSGRLIIILIPGLIGDWASMWIHSWCIFRPRFWKDSQLGLNATYWGGSVTTWLSVLRTNNPPILRQSYPPQLVPFQVSYFVPAVLYPRAPFRISRYFTKTTLGAILTSPSPVSWILLRQFPISLNGSARLNTLVTNKTFTWWFLWEIFKGIDWWVEFFVWSTISSQLAVNYYRHFSFCIYLLTMKPKKRWFILPYYERIVLYLTVINTS